MGAVNEPEIKKGRRRRLYALFRKEWFEIIRDPSAILIACVLPLLLIFLYGSGVSLDFNHLRVGVVLEESSLDGESFVRSITNSPYFQVELGRDRREFVDDMTGTTLRAMFVIPSYFTQFHNRSYQMANIQMIVDGSETNTANFVQKYAQGVFENWRVQMAKERGTFQNESRVKLEPRFWYNEGLESRFFLLPGSLSIIMTLVGSLLTALVVAREWERGSMEMLMSTTVSTFELVIGKIVPYFGLGMISMGICVALACGIYQLPLKGSLIVLGVFSALFLICSLGFGLMISTVTKNQVFAYQITLIAAFFPAYILSGFLFEIKSMPHWIQWLTYLVPAKYFVQNLQTLFLVGNVWSFTLLNTIPILGFGALFFIITKIKTVKRLD